MRMPESGATCFYRGRRGLRSRKRASTCRGRSTRATRPCSLRRKGGPVLSNDGGEAWDLGDGVLGVTFKTKANSLDPDSIDAHPRGVERPSRTSRRWCIANEGEHFCVGANLMLVAMAAGSGDWEHPHDGEARFQDATQRMKYATVPVVAAPFGMTLGGGLELCLGAARCRPRRRPTPAWSRWAWASSRGGAGTLNMLWRALEGVPEGTAVEQLRRRHAGVQEHRPRQGGHQRRRGEDARLLPQDGRRVLRPRAPALRGQGAGDRHRAPRAGTRPRPGLPPPGRERHRHADDDGRLAGRRRLRERARREDRACKVATVLCGGVDGGASRR
jgi:hypothetical protein